MHIYDSRNCYYVSFTYTTKRAYLTIDVVYNEFDEKEHAKINNNEMSLVHFDYMWTSSGSIFKIPLQLRKYCQQYYRLGSSDWRFYGIILLSFRCFLLRSAHFSTILFSSYQFYCQEYCVYCDDKILSMMTINFQPFCLFIFFANNRI